MLSALILSQHSYAAILRAEEQPDQRLVHSGPLVLGANLFKNHTPAVDRRPTCLTHHTWTRDEASPPALLRGLDCNIIFFKMANIQSLRVKEHSCRVISTKSPFLLPSVLPFRVRESGFTDIS
jgi:hypothetical protein